jgi:hypothetical protein
VSMCRTVVTFTVSGLKNRFLGAGCFGMFFISMSFRFEPVEPSSLWGFWGSRGAKRVTVFIFGVLGVQNL